MCICVVHEINVRSRATAEKHQSNDAGSGFQYDKNCCIIAMELIFAFALTTATAVHMYIRLIVLTSSPNSSWPPEVFSIF